MPSLSGTFLGENKLLLSLKSLGRKRQYVTVVDNQSIEETTGGGTDMESYVEDVFSEITLVVCK